MIFRTEQITPEEYMTLRTTAEWTEFPTEEAETCVRNAPAPEMAIKRSEPRGYNGSVGIQFGLLPDSCIQEIGRLYARSIQGEAAAETH